MIYTGLEGYTYSELLTMIERQNNPFAHELVRRSADAVQKIEDYEATIATLETELEEALTASGIAELEAKLQLAEDRANDFERKGNKFKSRCKELESSHRSTVRELNERIAALQRQIEKERSDRPATW